MKKSPEITLKDAIGKMLKTYKMDDKMVALKVEEVWPDLMGNTVARLTKGFRFYKGLLSIMLESAVLRQELSMSKSLLIKNLNEKLGGEVIEDIELK